MLTSSICFILKIFVFHFQKLDIYEYVKTSITQTTLLIQRSLKQNNWDGNKYLRTLMIFFQHILYYNMEKSVFY